MDEVVPVPVTVVSEQEDLAGSVGQDESGST